MDKDTGLNRASRVKPLLGGQVLGRRVTRLVTPLTLTLAIVFMLTTTALAAPKADLWPRWQANDAQSSQSVDHARWAALLTKHLTTDHPSGVNLFDYAGVDASDRAQLSEYVSMLEHTAVSKLNRAEQKAYWINLYNALTVKVILDNYPVDSIRDIRSGWFTAGPWELKLLEVEGEKLTLNDIEHRILRPIWKDMRVHFAVNCASIGCPNLAAEPYTPANMEALLDKGARTYVNNSRGVSLAGGRLKLSSIFDWFASDFGKSEREVIQSLIPYAQAGLAKRLESLNGGVNYAYDWALNKK